MNEQQKFAVVTGANRGLGLETCRQLARRGYAVLLTSRDSTKGKAAAAALGKEFAGILYRRLDVTDPDQIRQLAEFVEREVGRLDVLVNNAGVFLDSHHSPRNSIFDAEIETVRESLEINLYGPLRISQALIPLMRDEGRVVNVSSGMGQLAEMNGCCPGYRFSKVGLNALTRILGDELADTKIKVNSVCPGWVRTDMGGPNATRSVEEGADTIVWLATLPDDGPSGQFFRDRKRIPW